MWKKFILFFLFSFACQSTLAQTKVAHMPIGEKDPPMRALYTRSADCPQKVDGMNLLISIHENKPGTNYLVDSDRIPGDGGHVVLVAPDNYHCIKNWYCYYRIDAGMYCYCQADSSKTINNFAVYETDDKPDNLPAITADKSAPRYTKAKAIEMPDAENPFFIKLLFYNTETYNELDMDTYFTSNGLYLLIIKEMYDCQMEIWACFEKESALGPLLWCHCE